MLHYVHQQVANFARLPFGAEQVVHAGFMEPFLLKTAASCSRNDTMRAAGVNQNSKNKTK